SYCFHTLPTRRSSALLYSLGDPFLLARATAEVVDLFHRLRFVGKDRDILQIGCGTGRFEAAFSGSVRRAVGIDVSPRMIEVARRSEEHTSELQSRENI